MRENIVYMNVDDLIPYENNPRNNDKAVAKVAESIKEFGFKVPIVVDENNIIITGHTRLKASKLIGLKEVPVIVAKDLSEEQVKAFRLVDNKVGEIAEWNEDELKQELIELDAMLVDMTEFGFDDIADLLEDEIIEDDFDVAVPEEPKSKLGNIYKLGRHRLMCGDSTSKEDVSKLVAGRKVDMLLTDPPYNVAYEGKTESALTIQNDDMTNDEFLNFLTSAFNASDSVMKSGAVFYIWHAESEGYNFRLACVNTGWKVRQTLIWKKNHFVMGRQDYQWIHEPCLYGWKSGAGHLWAADRKQTTVLSFDKPLRNAEHPTMKPIALFDYQIKNNTKGGDAVLDVFGGSGTTIMACEQNGRDALVMELDPRYVDVIIKRWEDYTGQKAELVEEGE